LKAVCWTGLLFLAAAAPPTGTVITNTASATFQLGGATYAIQSNTVSTTVTAVAAVSLTANQAITATAGSSFTLLHTLTNTSTEPLTFQLAVSSGGTLQLGQLAILSDPSGSASVVAADLPITSVTLQPGQVYSLLITGTAPAQAVDGTAATVQLSATSGTVAAQNSDSVTLVAANSLSVSLSSPNSTATPGGSVTLNASATSPSGNAGPTAIQLNGVAQNDFVLYLPVPAGAVFQSATAPAGQVVYHQLGQPAGDYTTSATGTVDGVADLLTSLPGGSIAQIALVVSIPGNSTTSIQDTAQALWSNLSVPVQISSNTVTLAAQVVPSQIGFYTSNYSQIEPANIPGNPLFVQLTAPTCDINPSVIQTIPITVTSQLTGDTETFQATETAAGSGIYRIGPYVPTANANVVPVARGDGIMEILQNDTLTATAGGACAASATTKLLIDPSGVVFNSASDAPVTGATVTLINDATGRAAQVFQYDGATPAPSTVTTGAAGSYAFPLVAPGLYEIKVVPPSGYAFPSKRLASQLPASRTINSTGSYGQPFAVSGSARAPVTFDVPLDPAAPTGRLTINETANTTIAQIGDFIDYTVTIDNATGETLANPYMVVALPAGFVYQNGTATFNGAKITNPASTAASIRFPLPALAPGANSVLTFRVSLGPNAASGNGIDSAQVFGTGTGGAIGSNVSSVKVQITGGVFSDKAYIIGKVFADCRLSKIQDPGDPGIPGVRIYLNNGDYAITDAEGKYSFYGLTPRTHVAQVDTTTLPAGVSMEVLDNRNAMDPNSQFVDLQNGDMAKVNFAVAGCSDSLMEQIKLRQKALKNPAEIASASNILLSNQTAQSVNNAITTPEASGAIGIPGATPGSGSLDPSMLNGPQMGSALPGAGIQPSLGGVGDTGGSFAQPAPRPIYTPSSALFHHSAPGAQQAATPVMNPMMREPLEKVVLSLKPGLQFIGLRDGDILGTDQTSVRVAGPAGAILELSVNGAVIPTNRVGKKSVLAKTGIEAWEYIGVNLKAGENTLVLTAEDGFGNPHGTSTIHVTAPGTIAKISLSMPKTAVGDGATAIPVTVHLLDSHGNPVPGRALVTLDSTLGQWQVRSVSPQQPEIRAIVDNGVGRFLLLPPDQPGSSLVTVTDGDIKADQKIAFTPHLRPLIAVGLISGVINLRSLNPSALQPAQQGGIFERQIQSVAEKFDGGKGVAAARTALFLKGKILGSTLLTLSYDSDKPADTTLFRDINPDQFYPVYGDSSARGYEAQSTGRLYVLVQHGTSSVLYGDYSTQTENPARQLSQYSRVLNGAKVHLADKSDRFELSGFASSTNSTQVVQTIPANGTSGPFQLNINGVINSAQVDIITVDRNQPAIILTDKPLAQYTDYTIQPFTGLLLLNEPVPTLDANLNPQYIRVSYEFLVGGPKHMVGGVSGRVKLGGVATLGASTVIDNNPSDRQSISGVNATVKLFASAVAVAEIAHSTTALYGNGNGERVDIRRQGSILNAHVWGIHTDPGFYNQSSVESEGQSVYGAKATVRLNVHNVIALDALRTQDSVTGAKQEGESIALLHNLPHNILLEVGLRHSASNEQAALSSPAAGFIAPIQSALPQTKAAASAPTVGYTAARLKISAPVPYLPAATVYGLIEQALDGGGREIGVGGTYNINTSTKAYFRYDFINSLAGPYSLDPAVSQYTGIFGLSTTVASNTQLFNEYRLGDSLNGKDAEDAIGVRHNWKFADGFGISAAVQRIKPVYGSSADAGDAVNLGAAYTGANWLRASMDGQWQTSTTSKSILFTAAAAAKVSPAFTLLGRALYNTQTEQAPATGSRRLVTLQAGYAYRPVTSDQWNMLGRLEYKVDDDSTLGPGLNLGARSVIGATNVSFQPTPWLWLSGRGAFDAAYDGNNGVPGNSLYYMLGGRAIADVSRRWDVGAQSYVMIGQGQEKTAVGFEVGYLLWRDIWASIGYNFEGYNNPDLAGSQYTQGGVYFRIRVKFDQNLFSGVP
jgi:uncharacterized repeat protein (TIGR01451 family)